MVQNVIPVRHFRIDRTNVTGYKLDISSSFPPPKVNFRIASLCINFGNYSRTHVIRILRGSRNLFELHDYSNYRSSDYMSSTVLTIVRAESSIPSLEVFKTVT